MVNKKTIAPHEKHRSIHEKKSVHSEDQQLIYQLQNMLDSVPGDVYWKDLEGVWRSLNQRCAKSLFNMGFIQKACPSQVVGKTDYEIFDKVTADGYRKNDLEVIEKQTEVTRKEVTHLPNGKQVMLMSTKRPFFDEEKNLIGIIGNTVDITKEYELEQKAKQTETKAQMAIARAKTEEGMRKTVMVLVGDIVHDLRTPIATIRTVTNLLDEVIPHIAQIIEEAKEQGSEVVEKIKPRKLKPILKNRLTAVIKQAIGTMDDFINTSLLDLANAQKTVDEGIAPERLIQCSSRRIIENALEAYVFDEHITIHQAVSYDFFLMGNAILIMKILFNLIKNAVEQIEFNQSGEIFLATEEGAEYNLIKLKDTAGGVPEHLEKKLFEDYFTTKETGTGLGLASAKRLMENFGGTISFHNVPGQSIEFILSFPKV